MRRPGFGATILIICVLEVVGLGVRELRPLIPAPTPNELSREWAPYLKQGAYQRISWLPMGPAAMSEARHDDKPILLVIGTSWSRIGRLMDANVFTDPEIQEFLRRTFVCVRVDASAQPEWLSAYLP